MEKVQHSNNPAQIIEWAKKRGTTIKIMLPGTGETYVAVDKQDFIRIMSLHINPLKSESEIECTWYFEPVRKTLYA